MLAVNQHLRQLVRFLLSVAFGSSGGRLRPVWTTSGARYQYIPRRSHSIVNIVDLFEKLLDFESEISHHIHRLNLSRLDRCAIHDAKLWPTSDSSRDLNSFIERLDLSAEVGEALIHILRLTTTARPECVSLADEQVAVAECISSLRSYVARFDPRLALAVCRHDDHHDDRRRRRRACPQPREISNPRQRSGVSC